METIENTENINPEQQLSKKERSQQRRDEKEKVQQKNRSARKIKKYTLWIGIIIAIVISLYFGVSAIKKYESTRPGIEQADQGRDHIELGALHDAYLTNPPTSGPHAGPINFGVYDEEIPDENAVHNLEHGGIWITYKNLSDDEITQLEAIANKAPLSVLLSPRSSNDSRISIASWRRLMHLEEIDVSVIEEYIRRNINKSPEPMAN